MYLVCAMFIYNQLKPHFLGSYLYLTLHVCHHGRVLSYNWSALLSRQNSDDLWDWCLREFNTGNGNITLLQLLTQMAPNTNTTNQPAVASEITNLILA